MNKTLNDYIEEYFLVKEKQDEYKKYVDEDNKEIKKLMKEQNITEFNTENGLIAKLSIQNRESFNEPALIEKLIEINAKEVIDLVPTINWDKVEDMIYNGNLDASILAEFKQIKEVEILKVSKKKGA